MVTYKLNWIPLVWYVYAWKEGYTYIAPRVAKSISYREVTLPTTLYYVLPITNYWKEARTETFYWKWYKECIFGCQRKHLQGKNATLNSRLEKLKVSKRKNHWWMSERKRNILNESILEQNLVRVTFLSSTRRICHCFSRTYKYSFITRVHTGNT